MNHYRAFGLTIACKQPLPGLGEPRALPPADIVLHMQTDTGTGTTNRLGDHDSQWIDVFVGNMREHPPLVISRSSGSAGYRFRYSDGTEFIIAESGGEIRACWREPYTVEDMMTYFQGPILGFVLRLRGIVSMHASAVAIGDQAVLILGPGGAGKSTTAAAFALRGHAVLADDVSAIEEMATQIRILPAYPHLRLWGTSVGMLYGSEHALHRITPNWDKFDFRLSGPGMRFQETPLPLGAIYLLGERSAAAGTPSVQATGKREAMMVLTAHTYVNYALTAEMRATEFDLIARLLRNIPVRRITPHADTSRIQDLCDLILADFSACRAPVVEPPLASS